MHHGIGNPVFNQFIWRFGTRLSGDELTTLHAHLSNGLLARRAVAPTLPTARHRWIASDESLPLNVSPVAIAEDSVRRWAEQRVVHELDPEAGTGWQLASAPLAEGGTVVSLVCSHMVADGAAMIAAVRHANRGVASVTASDLGGPPSRIVGLVDDIGDTIGQLTSIGSWLPRVVSAEAPWFGRAPSVNGVASAPTSPRRRFVARNTGPWVPAYVVAECRAAEWHTAASDCGGTSSSLFLAVMTGVAERLGRACPGDELRWSVPYSDREPNDLDANSTKIVPVPVTVCEPGERDLKRPRKAMKTALTDFSGKGDPGLPQALVQMLPDALVARVPTRPDGAEGLCSNLGRLPDDFTSLGGAVAESVSARASFAGANESFARALGGGFTAWACETGDTMTITLHGMDPDRVRTDDDLRDAVATLLRRWGITYRFW